MLCIINHRIDIQITNLLHVKNDYPAIFDNNIPESNVTKDIRGKQIKILLKSRSFCLRKYHYQIKIAIYAFDFL